MKRLITITIVFTLLLTSCVSKKKYVALEENLANKEQELTNTKGELQETTLEKEALEGRFAKIKSRIDDYNSKINSLNTENSSLNNLNSTLNQSLFSANYDKLIVTDDNNIVMSESVKNKIANTLSRMPYDEIKNAKTLKDSINLALAYNFRKSLSNNGLGNDININIDKTVVMISVSDKMLFNTGSYKVKTKANKILERLATIINSEPSMDVIIEGHTDSRTINTSVLKDNWDLSVKRATSIVRLLQSKYQVDPTRLIASGRSSYLPIADNQTKDGRASNRRTNIIILPNLNKFFALLEAKEHTVLAD